MSIKQAMLATHEEIFESEYSTKVKGDIIYYQTSREVIVNKLTYGDLIYIRVMGSGEIRLICKFIELIIFPVRCLKLEVLELPTINCSVFYRFCRIHAGAEHGWVKYNGVNEWIDI